MGFGGRLGDAGRCGALTDPLLVSQLEPDLWMSDGAGGKVQVRNTCTRPSWQVEREAQVYRVDICDVGNASSVEMHLLFQAAPVASPRLSGNQRPMFDTGDT